MALRCLGRYRNAALRLFVEPGEVLTNLSPDEEAHVLRDSPGSFEVVRDTPPAARAAAAVHTTALDAPPAHTMLTRETAARKETERGSGPRLSRADHPGLVPPAPRKR